MNPPWPHPQEKTRCFSTEIMFQSLSFYPHRYMWLIQHTSTQFIPSQPQLVDSNEASLDGASQSSYIVITENLFFKNQANHKMEQTVTVGYSPDILKLPISIIFFPDSKCQTHELFPRGFHPGLWWDRREGAYHFSYSSVFSSC